jgi:zinc transporter
MSRPQAWNNPMADVDDDEVRATQLSRTSSTTSEDRKSTRVTDKTEEVDARITEIGLGDTDGDGLIAAIVLQGKGEAEVVETWRECRWEEWRQKKTSVWYHCNFGVSQAVRWLHGTGPDDARIGEGNAAQMIDFESMPRCREVWRDSTGDGLDDTQCIFLSLRGINTWEKNGGMVGLRMWIGPRRLITVRRRFLKSVAYTRDELAQLGDDEEAWTVGQVVARILVHLMHFFREPLKDLEDKIASIEERTLDE